MCRISVKLGHPPSRCHQAAGARGRKWITATGRDRDALGSGSLQASDRGRWCQGSPKLAALNSAKLTACLAHAPTRDWAKHPQSPLVVARDAFGAGRSPLGVPPEGLGAEWPHARHGRGHAAAALGFALAPHRDGGLRYESPSRARTCAWWSSRSVAALASNTSPNSAGHSSNARFDVKIGMERWPDQPSWLIRFEIRA